LGITSIEETRRTLDVQLSTLQQQKLATQAELAERRATLNEILRQSGSPVAGVSNVAMASTPSNAPASTNFAIAVPADKMDEYRRICGLIETLGRREQELLVTYTEQYALVRVVRAQLETNRRLKADLETAHPSLVSIPVNTAPATPGQKDGRDEFVSQAAHVRGLESRLQELTAQYEEARKKAAEFYEAEGTLTELQRKLQLEETNFLRFSHNLEQSRIDERLGAGKISNISIIQEPTPPAPVATKALKLMAMILVGGIGAAFGLAFLIEFYLDQTLRRPSEIQPRLGLPLFISIPLQELNGKGQPAGGPANRPLLQEHNSGSNGSPEPSSLPVVPASWETPPWDSRHQMQPFFETLRDRLIQYFEAKNLTHKPKLVSVTSCDHASGVSTIAAGLAASLSETGEGNVLLVDMNIANGSARRFYKGDLACGLDDALEQETRHQALVQDKLYVVTESNPGEGLPSALPTRFKSIVPRLKASDFDYIIFDMPPVTEISITPRLSKFMDTVLMVVEAEKTDLEVVRRANAILAEAKANVGIVFNKQRTYVPKLLQKEL
jgi:Mrp family chromosome partitioning ATPase